MYGLCLGMKIPLKRSKAVLTIAVFLLMCQTLMFPSVRTKKFAETTAVRTGTAMI